jgi:hypothetical protein
MLDTILDLGKLSIDKRISTVPLSDVSVVFDQILKNFFVTILRDQPPMRSGTNQIKISCRTDGAILMRDGIHHDQSFGMSNVQYRTHCENGTSVLRPDRQT